MDIEDLLQDVYDAFKDKDELKIFELGSAIQRLVFFKQLRELIAQKEYINDETAANILGWAYEQLGE